METFFLRSNVQIEPLINYWHAHSLLIAPQTAAMLVTNSHLPIMQSYAQMPMAHVAALKNPDMVGGPFIDYGGQRVEEIRELKTETEEKVCGMVSFAKAIHVLFGLLRKQNGGPLHLLYNEVPDAVKGYVELVYDLEHNPTFRFIEALLYKSEYYKPQVQSIALSVVNDDNRQFIFSTPRLRQKNTLHLPISFSDQRIDKLVELKYKRSSFAEVVDVIQAEESSYELLKSLLTTEPPRMTNARPVDDQIRVKYFGHACVLIESQAVTILTDPLISYKYESDLPRFTYEDLPSIIDFVVITHNHHDHIVIETLLQLRSRIKTIIVPRNNAGSLQDPSMRLVLQNIGFKNVIELDDMESLATANGSITAIPFFGEHCDLNIRSKATYCIQMCSESFLICADSNSMSPQVYENVHRVTGNIATIFLGLECTGAPMSWAYGSLFPRPIDRKLDQIRRSNGSNAKMAIELVKIFKPQRVFLYAMGLEPWLNYFMALQHGHREGSAEEIDKVILSCNQQSVYAETLFASKEFTL
jgi:hypothetical protein